MKLHIYDILHLCKFNLPYLQENLIMIFLYIAPWNNDCIRFRGGIKAKYFICWLIIDKPQPNLHSGETSTIQGHLPWSRGCLLMNRGSTVFNLTG